jgi:hypothetical protein
MKKQPSKPLPSWIVVSAADPKLKAAVENRLAKELVKVSNPYSKVEDPVSWHGWETGFQSKPNTNVSQSEIATYGEAFAKAFYRGQGAQTVRNLKA